MILTRKLLTELLYFFCLFLLLFSSSSSASLFLSLSFQKKIVSFFRLTFYLLNLCARGFKPQEDHLYEGSLELFPSYLEAKLPELSCADVAAGCQIEISRSLHVTLRLQSLFLTMRLIRNDFLDLSHILHKTVSGCYLSLSLYLSLPPCVCARAFNIDYYFTYRV